MSGFARVCTAVAVSSLLLGGGPLALARDLPEANPSRVGMSAERLERLTRHMEQAVADGVMVGGIGLIARKGRVVYRQTYGLADLEPRREMTEDTIFRIYSMSDHRRR